MKKYLSILFLLMLVTSALNAYASWKIVKLEWFNQQKYYVDPFLKN